MGQGEPGGAIGGEVDQGAFLQVLGAGGVFGDQARVAHRADAAGVGVVDVAGPGAGGGAGEFQDFLPGPLRRIEPVGAERDATRLGSTASLPASYCTIPFPVA